MAYDTVVVLLATFKLWHLWSSGGQSRLVEVILRDQLIWYLLVATVSIINLVVAYATPAPQGTKQRGVVTCALTAFTSISVSCVTISSAPLYHFVPTFSSFLQTCRVILNIRETAAKEMTTILPRAANGSRGLTFQTSAQDPGAAVDSLMMSAPRTPITAAFKFDKYLPCRSATVAQIV